MARCNIHKPSRPGQKLNGAEKKARGSRGGANRPSQKSGCFRWRAQGHVKILEATAFENIRPDREAERWSEREGKLNSRVAICTQA